MPTAWRSQRRWRRHRSAIPPRAWIALGLVIVAGIAFGHGDRFSAQPAQMLRHPGTGAGPQPGLAVSGDALSAAISAAQRQLQGNDRDWSTWANLGAAYVEEGRVTVDPSYYPKAEGALRRSVELNPNGNFAADIGLGALANARHEFGDAATAAQRALAADPYSATANGVLGDPAGSSETIGHAALDAVTDLVVNYATAHGA